MTFTKQELEELYSKQGWNEPRLRRSFANKQELVLLSGFANVERDGLIFEVSFEQIHEEAYGFAVHVCIELHQSKENFIGYLFIEGNRRPLHKPVMIPVKYGFTAQANQLLTAVIGLQYVYNVAGVEDLDYYPDGMAVW
ncbi:hypothetical protein [Acidovorax sp.]|uniref:hypothetical protein n=1 Tax=Acidovorax sp. TaxID=1872122 RepID=UPI00391F0903